MVSLAVGQTLPLTLAYKDQAGSVMQQTPTPDAPPVWGNTAPAVEILTPSGSSATAKALIAGIDTVTASLTVAGKLFSATLPLTVLPVSGLKFNFTYGASWATAPAGAQASLNAAAAFLSAAFPSSNATINIQVGWGEVGGSALGSNALGSSISMYATTNYDSLRSILLARNAPGSSTLPPTPPLAGMSVFTQANAKVLGLSSSVGLDGYVGFRSYTTGVFEHEITEIMGRQSFINYQPNYYGPMDLYRYLSPGVRCVASGGSGSTAYFSIDNGTTNLAAWNNNPGNGDLGDWISGLGNDAANDYGSGGPSIFSDTDIKLMQAMGW